MGGVELSGKPDKMLGGGGGGGEGDLQRTCILSRGSCNTPSGFMGDWNELCNSRSP